MTTECPPPADLLLAVLGAEDASMSEALARHTDDCADCGAELDRLRGLVAELRRRSSESPSNDPHLDDLGIAGLLDRPDPSLHRQSIRHLARCTPCRIRFAASMRLLHDPLVLGEIERVESDASHLKPRWSRTTVARFVAGVAAAAVAVVLLWPRSAQPPGSEPGSPAYREHTLTTTAAPGIVGPVGVASPADSLRWTGVPGADLYRVTVWRRDGSVAWQGEIRDTVLAFPPELQGDPGRALLWDVKARTGWDRWVASDLAEFTMEPGEEIRK